MPPEYLPDEDEREGEEGEEDADASADDGDKDAATEEPKPEGQTEDGESQSRDGEAAEEPEEDEEPSQDGALDPALQAKLLEILNDPDEGIEAKVAQGVKTAQAAAQAEADAEAEAKRMEDLFTKAEDDDHPDQEAALLELGKIARQRRQQMKVEAPIIARARQEAAREFDSEYQAGMDTMLTEFDSLFPGVLDAAAALSNTEKQALDPRRYPNKTEWTRAVMRAVVSKVRGGKDDSGKAKAERRRQTAERAAAGGGTARMPAGRAGDAAESEGQSARDWLLGKK